MGRMGWMSAFASSPSSPERGHIAPSLRSYPKSIHFMTLGYPHPFLGAILRPGGLFWKPLTQFPKLPQTRLHISLAQELSQDHTFYDLGVSPCLPQQRFSDVRVHGMVHHVACMPWCTMLRAFCGAPCCAHAVAHDVACMP